VGEEVDFGAAGLSEELGEAMEELVVRDRLERPFVLHGWNIRRVFSTSGFAPQRVQTGWLGFEHRSRRLLRGQGIHGVLKANVRDVIGLSRSGFSELSSRK
jgi:hypothetical protein